MRARHLAGAVALLVAAAALAQNATGPAPGDPISPGYVAGADAGFHNITASGTLGVGGAITTGTVVSAPLFDGGVFLGTSASLSASANTPIVDAGVTILPTTGKLCLDGPSCSVFIQWGGSNTVQLGTSAANVLAVSGVTVTGPSKLRDSISNDTSGAACSSNGGAVCLNDANGLAIANGSGTTLTTVNGSTGNIVVSSMAVPVVHNAVTGPALEYGEQVLTAGVATITFGTAFTGTPTCFCADTSNTTETSCSTTAESTTQVTLNGTTTGTYSWVCIGPR